ncbi:MAG: YvcK family protein [Desulfobulbaceae bacterium]|nr:YvcK family protein [Desulfobulbaceae bacterium]
MQNTSQLIADTLEELRASRYSALDLLAENSEEENLVSLFLGTKAQAVSPALLAQFSRYREQMERTDTSGVKVVVFGGGTGLATLIGGDSRREDWPQQPFTGMKQLFADLHSVVCVSDDGGSTGELRKLLPLVGLGDLRHVLLASIRRDALIRTYALSEPGAQQLVLTLHGLFNYRFTGRPQSLDALLEASAVRPHVLPGQMRILFMSLLDALFTDKRLEPVLDFPQCLGNLLLASAIYKHLDPVLTTNALLHRPEALHRATGHGLAEVARVLGMAEDAVLPASLTPAELCLLYSNGVLATSEDKSSTARRHYPVDRVMTAFCDTMTLHPRLLGLIAEADILLFAPGSLYTSIIPILQIPGVPEAIRANQRAMKLLVANIWVQTGETDATREAPERKFYVSDMIYAYHRNIPGGVERLFSHVIALNMADIPSSVLQGYALEAKEPIFIDRERVQQLGFGLIEAAVFSRELLRRQNRIQHDPDALAKTIKTLWILRSFNLLNCHAPQKQLPEPIATNTMGCPARPIPCSRYQALQDRLQALKMGRISTTAQADTEAPEPLSPMKHHAFVRALLNILWRHPDIPVAHLMALKKIWLIDTTVWERAQEWDNIYSTYQPDTQRILIREDQCRNARQLEIAFLVALGQSLLGNYVAKKSMEPLLFRGAAVGLLYRLQLQSAHKLDGYLAHGDIGQYLQLTRMHPSPVESGVFTRAVNLAEGFTPPGLFFGLFYAWYLDSTLAPNIEYKMSIMRHEQAAMIPEQMRISRRRSDTIDFFREKVFRQITMPHVGQE